MALPFHPVPRTIRLLAANNVEWLLDSVEWHRRRLELEFELELNSELEFELVLVLPETEAEAEAEADTEAPTGGVNVVYTFYFTLHGELSGEQTSESALRPAWDLLLRAAERASGRAFERAPTSRCYASFRASLRARPL